MTFRSRNDKQLTHIALDVPFLLLPFRPSSDPSAAKTFIRNYFFPQTERTKLAGYALTKELRMTEVMVIIAVMKWCWARLPGGVVTWEAYQGFKVGEKGDVVTLFFGMSTDQS